RIRSAGRSENHARFLVPWSPHYVWHSVKTWKLRKSTLVGVVAESVILKSYQHFTPANRFLYPLILSFFLHSFSRNGNSDVGRRGHGQSLRKLANETTSYRLYVSWTAKK